MSSSLHLSKLEKLITHDNRFSFTAASYLLILVTYANLTMFKSFAVGIAVFTLYFVINTVFLGQALFKKEDAFFRLALGTLVLVMVLGFFGWLILIIYNLDVVRFALVLFIVATFCSFSNRSMIHKNGS